MSHIAIDRQLYEKLYKKLLVCEEAVTPSVKNALLDEAGHYYKALYEGVGTIRSERGQTMQVDSRLLLALGSKVGTTRKVEHPRIKEVMINECLQYAVAVQESERELSRAARRSARTPQIRWRELAASDESVAPPHTPQIRWRNI